MTTLRGARVTLRPVERADVPTLLTILREPSVAAVWSSPDDEQDARLLLGEDADGGEAITTFAVTLPAATIGWICGWEKLEPEYRHAGVDLFLGGEHQGHGYGGEAIRLVCRWLFEIRGHHRITIDPAASNARAIRAYEKIGFKRVGPYVDTSSVTTVDTTTACSSTCCRKTSVERGPQARRARRGAL